MCSIFSIIIPTCNRSGSLQRLLKSVDALVTARPACNAEVIAVDNGSVDETPGGLAELALKSTTASRFTRLTEARKGKASALNRGHRGSERRRLADRGR